MEGDKTKFSKNITNLFSTISEGVNEGKIILTHSEAIALRPFLTEYSAESAEDKINNMSPKQIADTFTPLFKSKDWASVCKKVFPDEIEAKLIAGLPKEIQVMNAKRATLPELTAKRAESILRNGNPDDELVVAGWAKEHGVTLPENKSLSFTKEDSKAIIKGLKAKEQALAKHDNKGAEKANKQLDTAFSNAIADSKQIAKLTPAQTKAFVAAAEAEVKVFANRKDTSGHLQAAANLLALLGEQGIISRDLNNELKHGGGIVVVKDTPSKAIEAGLQRIIEHNAIDNETRELFARGLQQMIRGYSPNAPKVQANIDTDFSKLAAR